MSIRRNVLVAACAFVLGVGGALLLLREPTTPLTKTALNQARERWQQTAIRNYQTKYRMHGSLYEVHVHGGFVVSIAVNGLSPSIAEPGAYSIDGLFETLEAELDNLAEAAGALANQPGVVTARVRFHHRLGYPERYIRGSSGLGRGASIEMLDFRQATQSP